MKNFFLSLKTTVWTLLVLVCFFFIGSFLMPLYPETFAPMNETILFDWLAQTAAGNLWQTWWFFACLAVLLLLTINTIVCSIQAIRGKWTRRDFLSRISPQVVHLGFLFILLAHLLGAGGGYRLSGVLPEGAAARLPRDNLVLYLDKIQFQSDARGYMTGWAASVSLHRNTEEVKRGILGPNQPLFFEGTGVYLKSLVFEQRPAALLLVTKDPGAVWALLGAVLFMLGSTAILVLPRKKS